MRKSFKKNQEEMRFKHQLSHSLDESIDDSDYNSHLDLPPMRGVTDDGLLKKPKKNVLPKRKVPEQQIIFKSE